MKKIVALGAIAALACGMVFADEPAIDTKIADFNGNAEVKWGMDLDAGQHGFTNSTGGDLKINLWNEGTKETSGDGIWADIQIKGTKGAVENGAATWGTLSVERAKLHFNDFYVDIKSGGTKVGEWKADTAIHGDVAWLASRGLDFSQGIQAGYDAEAFKFSLDFRSYDTTKTKYSSAYGMKAEAGLKDNLVPGLTVDAGVSYNLSTSYNDVATDAKIEDKVADENASLANHFAKIVTWNDDKGDDNTDQSFGTATYKDYHMLGYGLKAAYKFSIDDEMYVKPSVGFDGTYATGSYKVGKDWKPATESKMELAASVLLGWGDQADANAGVPFLDGDSAKKVTPGVGVAAYIPLPTVTTKDDTKHTEHDALQAFIVPTFFLGDGKVEGLKAAAYGEIGLYKFIKPEDQPKPSSDGKVTEHYGSAKENETTAIAFTAGVSYGITLDNDATVTPKFGFRYANGAYVSNGLEGKYSDIFKNLGMQKKVELKDQAKSTYDGDFLNLKIGVDLAGFIDNVTFSANYNSANISNAISDDAKSDPNLGKNAKYDSTNKYYNIKAGTFDIGCKISL